MVFGNITARNFIQPRYYSGFHCIGSECSSNCCHGWNILWVKDEVEKLKKAECSEELHKLIDSSFKPSDDNNKFLIKFNEKKRCPLLDDNGLCRIHKELGEEYLSFICSTYPRRPIVHGNAVMNCCNMSCLHIMDILCNEKDCMKLDNYSSKVSKKASAYFFSGDEIKKHPELSFFEDIFDFFYELISDTSRRVETSLVLGAIAARSLSKFAENREYSKITGTLSSLKSQLGAPAQIKTLEELSPNYSVKLGFLSETYRELFKSNITDILSENGILSADKYNEGIGRFNAAFADRPFALRNIALNLFIECALPFKDLNKSIFENYCHYAAAIAEIKYIAAACFLSENSEETFKKTTSDLIGRCFSHNESNIGKVLNIYNKHNCMSPAYIALILN